MIVTVLLLRYPIQFRGIKKYMTYIWKQQPYYIPMCTKCVHNQEEYLDGIYSFPIFSDSL